MKFIASILLSALLAFVAGLFTQLPWWIFVISSFIVAALLHQSPGKSFLSGFLGLFLLWIVLAFIKDAANEHILSTKVALILPLGGSYMMLILVTGIIGGLISGFAALTGSFVKK
ncbi:hypothetical protein [Sediminibacterium sp.]|uniref:hypothetical protein n=1 Tax=Sediminibacterium sp. TaxID=1917865 RepID=UPI003F6EF772